MKIFPGNTGTKPTCVLGSSEQAAVADQLQQVGLKTVRDSQLVMFKKLNLSLSTESFRHSFQWTCRGIKISFKDYGAWI